MKTIIAKEIRTIAPWATLLLLLLMGYALGTNALTPPDNGDTFWTPQQSWLVILAAPFFAIYCGALQCAFETMGDGGMQVGAQSALQTYGGSFLMQRPVSLLQIFWSKAAVGIGSTLLVFGIPFLFQEWWRVGSGHYGMPAHFEWQVAARCVLLTFAAWSTGVIIANYQPMSRGSRVLPLAALVAVALLPINIELLMAPLFVLAAAGVYRSLGEASRMDRLSLATLAAIYGAGGVCIVASLIVVISFLFADNKLRNWNYSGAKGQFYSDTVPANRDLISLLDHINEQPLEPGVEISFEPSYNSFGQLSNRNSQASFFDPIDRVYKQYDIETGRLVGILDRSGFRRYSEIRSIVPFSRGFVSNDSVNPLVTPDFIAVVNLDRRTIRRFFVPDPREKIVGLYRASSNDMTTGYSVVTTRRVVETDITGKETSSWSSFWPTNTIGKISDHGADRVLWFGRDSDLDQPTGAVVLRNGQEVESRSFSYPPPTTLSDLAEASPFWAVVPALVYMDHLATHNGSFPDPVQIKFAAVLVLLSAFLMLLLSRRLEWTPLTTVGWVCALLLTGPAPLFAAFALYRWPARLPCPECGKKRLVTSAHCRNCSATWPRPASDGAEIFDGDRYAARSVGISTIETEQKFAPKTEALRMRGTVSAFRALLNKELRSPFHISFICIALFAWDLVLTSGIVTGQNSSFAVTLHYGSVAYNFLTVVVAFAFIIVPNAFTRDQPDAARSFSIQRPTSMATQFLIKAGVGTGFYSVLCGLALTAYYYFLLQGGHTPGPFPQAAWYSMICAPFVGLLFGFGGAAGLLRFGAWTGRVLPVIFCIGAALAAYDAEGTVWFAPVIFVGYVFTGLTMWGAYLSQGEMARQPKITRFTAGAVVAGALLFSSLCLETVISNNYRGVPWFRFEMGYLTPRSHDESFRAAALGYDNSQYYWYADKSRGILLCYDIFSNRLVGVVDGSGWRAGSKLPTKVVAADVRKWGPQTYADELPLIKGPREMYVVSLDPPGARLATPADITSQSSPEQDEESQLIPAPAPNANLAPLSFGLDGLLLILTGVSWQVVARLAAVPTALGIFLTLLMARRRGWRRDAAVKWGFGALLLGLYAPFIISALYPRAARVRCPNCGKKRLVISERCEHCTAPWSAPARSGMEIFELPDGPAPEEMTMVG